ncbi:MAG TPA: DUF6758 family protein [Nocardioidaceae bacterium]|nr:DUF6758 family protein [Nocardioidaceae bacterium]
MDERLTVVDPVAAAMNGILHSLPAPLWVPWPPPVGWTFAGLVHGALSDDVPSAGTAGSWSGVDPFGDPVEAVFVCEEAGTGLGGRFAGLPTHYPSGDVGVGSPHAQFEVDGRTVSLWKVDGPRDRAAYVGEAKGRWLWVVLYPAEASAVMVEPLTLVDARSLGAELAVMPLGELSPRLLMT